jgi:hypothetical protein
MWSDKRTKSEVLHFHIGGTRVVLPKNKFLRYSRGHLMNQHANTTMSEDQTTYQEKYPSDLLITVVVGGPPLPKSHASPSGHRTFAMSSKTQCPIQKLLILDFYIQYPK